MSDDRRYVEIFDTTLRDGSQLEGISLTVEDKLKVAEQLDWLGVAWIEGGFPQANPRDAEFFKRALRLQQGAPNGRRLCLCDHHGTIVQNGRPGVGDLLTAQDHERAGGAEIDLSLERMIWRIVTAYATLAGIEAPRCTSGLVYAAFDGLTVTYLLRYVEDPAATLRELARVLRPGGTLVIDDLSRQRDRTSNRVLLLLDAQAAQVAGRTGRGHAHPQPTVAVLVGRRHLHQRRRPGARCRRGRLGQRRGFRTRRRLANRVGRLR